jgi:adenine-specific DNA-methyltransferase
MGPQVLLPEAVFLIEYLITVFTKALEEAVILDLFSGSATTAHAVMSANARDGGNRRHIQVQLPEPVEDADGNPSTLAELARRRIDLAGTALTSDRSGQLAFETDSFDIGFRSYELSDTNFAKWRVTSDVEQDALQQHLLSLRDSAEDDATVESLLTEILLKQGHSLTERVETVDVAGLDVRSVGDNLLLAYLDEHKKPTLEQLRSLVDAAGAKIVILEDAFHGDDELKTNMVQLCKTKNIELWTA